MNVLSTTILVVQLINVLTCQVPITVPVGKATAMTTQTLEMLHHVRVSKNEKKKVPCLVSVT